MVIFTLPAFLIIIARGLNCIGDYQGRVLVILITVILTIYVLDIYYREDLKITWRDIINYLERNIEDNDVVIVSSAKEVRMFSYYGKNGIRFNKTNALRIDEVLGSQLLTGGFIYSGWMNNKLVGINTAKQLKKIMNFIDPNRIWLIISRWSMAAEGTEMVKYMNNRYKNTQQKIYAGATVYYYISSNK